MYTKLARFFLILVLVAGSVFLAACIVPQTATPTQIFLPEEIVFYNWVEDMPYRVLDAFTKEYGVKVRYLTYESQEEAIENIKAGEIYDVVVIDNRFIPNLINENLLAPIDHANISNINEISKNFRDQPYDPGNHYSVPYNWGITGLVVRSDLVDPPVASWKDLWSQENAGKVILWRGTPRDSLGAALKSLGYSINSENPQELERALARLKELRPNLIFAEDLATDPETISPFLATGSGVMGIGWSVDALEGRRMTPVITFVLPEEGGFLWGDNYVIPANSPNRPAAELLLNFLLRHEICALITNENFYPTGNEKASPYIEAELRDDPVIFPPQAEIERAEVILPLSPEGELLYTQVWERFIEGEP